MRILIVAASGAVLGAALVVLGVGIALVIVEEETGRGFDVDLGGDPDVVVGPWTG